MPNNNRYDIFERGVPVYDQYARPTGQMDFPDTHWIMSSGEHGPGINLAGYEIPTGAEAEFIRDELKVDPKFFCYAIHEYYVLIESTKDGVMVLLERRFFHPDQKMEWDRITSGEWEVVEEED